MSFLVLCCIVWLSVGRPKHARVMAGSAEGDLFVGEAAKDMRGILSLAYPTKSHSETAAQTSSLRSHYRNATTQAKLTSSMSLVLLWVLMCLLMLAGCLARHGVTMDWEDMHVIPLNSSRLDDCYTESSRVESSRLACGGLIRADLICLGWFCCGLCCSMCGLILTASCQ